MPDLNYLCIENIFEGDNEIKFITNKAINPVPPAPNIEYSTDGGVTWEAYLFADTNSVITLALGSKCYFRGDNHYISKSASGTYYLSSSQKVNISGNIMSLLDKNCESTTISSNYCFCYLFEFLKVVDAGSLILPATTLAYSCYADMFNGCTSLEVAPELPATTLAEYCYYMMFNNCTSLRLPPEVPAMILANYCYNSMFQGCTSLEVAPKLPATTLADSCYKNMFNGCTSLKASLELPATALANMCYYAMFYNCASLRFPPELPATTLADSCYGNMFYGCTSLIFPPKLPATALANMCYYAMFEKCTSLKLLPELPATTLVTNCYNAMFAKCTSLKMSVSPQSDKQCIFKIPASVDVANTRGSMFMGVPGMPLTPEINTNYYTNFSPQITNKKYKFYDTFVSNPPYEAKILFKSNNQIFNILRRIDEVASGSRTSNMYYGSTKISSNNRPQNTDWINANIVWEAPEYKEIILFGGVDASPTSEFISWLYDNSYQVVEENNFVSYNLVSYARQHNILPGQYNIKVKALSEFATESDWSNTVEYSLTSLIGQKIGTTHIKDFRFGKDEVKKIYFNNELIYTCEYKPAAPAASIKIFNGRYLVINKVDSNSYKIYANDELIDEIQGG